MVAFGDLKIGSIFYCGKYAYKKTTNWAGTNLSTHVGEYFEPYMMVSIR